ncbi:hypothetical protein BOX15_Mlig011201g1 [Macrostomum lignano]|uniref:PLAT domain-containing protein n=1 Tax=Macrostomum lignano TaxID=282301 RepID=A0A267DL10_9PLAT|nr:hypothetical protein BOX15_Mlig011201g1 [Macrostomum lignano]
MLNRKLDSLSDEVKAIYEKQRDKRAQVMELLTQTLLTMTTVTLEQIKLATATMQVITSDMDDLPRNGQLNIKNKVLEVTAALESLIDTIPKQSLTEVVTNTLAAVTQAMTAASIQTKRGTLSDMDKSAGSEFHYYDTDWESSREGFSDMSPAAAKKGLLVETNGIVQGSVSSEVSTDGFGAIQSLVRLLNQRQTSGSNPVRITTAQMSLSLNKSKPNDLSGVEVAVGRSKLQLPTNLCNLTLSGRNCSSDGSAISVAVIAMPTNPYSGIGTNKNPPIPTAAEILTINMLYSKGAEIPVPQTGSGNEFKFVLQKDQTFFELQYIDPDPKRPMPRIPDGVEVPGTAEGPFDKNRVMYQKLILHEFNMLGDDQSVNFQLKFLNFTPGPSNKCRQFLVVGRLWQAPSLMDPGESFDWWGMIPTSTAYCFRLARPDEPDPFTFFVSNEKFKIAKARVMRTAYDWDRKINTVKFGVRELEEEEWDRYTENRRPPVPYTYTKQQFTVKYNIRIYSSTCYSITPGQTSWNSNGCLVGSRTTILQTECMCSHLTSFAGGFIEAPNTIDWEYAFSNFDFTKNPTLFITEIMIAVFFIILFVWARRWDKKDVEKLGVSPLPDNDPEHKYLYELVVTTGLRRNAGTESKVYFALSGARNDSGVRALDDTKRRILQRGCTNRFLLAVEKPLGDLNFMRLWHDNSGKGSAASWYCDTIVAIDLQTRLRYHFVVNRWFAVEEDDGFIDRVLPVAGPEELQQFGYMFSTHTKKDLTDGHLWLSIMARPPESRFTRVERVACCLLLLFLTMVTACMFYQKEGPTKSTSTALNVGPFSLTPRMIFVGVITNVITFVPLFIVMELFRRSRLHTGHVNQLLSAIDKHFEGARSQKSWHVTCDLEDQQETAEGQRAPHTASTGVTNQEITTAMLELREFRTRKKMCQEQSAKPGKREETMKTNMLSKKARVFPPENLRPSLGGSGFSLG